MSMITVVGFHNFQSLIVLGRISSKDKERIAAIKSTMSSGEYAGYSPPQQEKYEDIEEILAGYEQSEICRI